MFRASSLTVCRPAQTKQDAAVPHTASQSQIDHAVSACRDARRFVRSATTPSIARCRVLSARMLCTAPLQASHLADGEATRRASQPRRQRVIAEGPPDEDWRLRVQAQRLRQRRPDEWQLLQLLQRCTRKRSGISGSWTNSAGRAHLPAGTACDPCRGLSHVRLCVSGPKLRMWATYSK